MLNLCDCKGAQIKDCPEMSFRNPVFSALVFLIDVSHFGFFYNLIHK